eukprot:COSAG01_NODE_740_length_13891_cov_35.573013_9_plen_229_part_00
MLRQQWLNSGIEFLKFIFPTYCLSCKKLQKEDICIDCMKTLKVELKQCKINIAGVNNIWALSEYEGIIKQIIHDLKFKYNKKISKVLHDLIIRHKVFKGIQADVCIAVPSHRSRKSQRGYDVVQLIFREALAQNNIKNISNMIIRKKKTAVLFDLNAEERQIEISGAFELNKKSILDINKEIYYKDILIYDDILTTGSTVKEIASSLAKYKPKSVTVLAYATVKENIR